MKSLGLPSLRKMRMRTDLLLIQFSFLLIYRSYRTTTTTSAEGIWID